MKKDIVAIFGIILLIAVLINGTEIQSVDEYYLTHIDDITPDRRSLSAFAAILSLIITMISIPRSARRILSRRTALFLRRPNMSSARETRFSIFSTAPFATIRYRWSIRARIRTATAAFMFREYIICMNFHAGRSPDGCIGWTENFRITAARSTSCATVRSSSGYIPAISGTTSAANG